MRQELYKLMQNSGLHRTNLFRVEISVPPILNAKVDRLSLSAFSAPIPGYSSDRVDTGYSGVITSKFQNNITFADINIGFYVANDFYEHKIFTDWRNHMVDPVSGKIAYYDDYVTDLRVTPIRKNKEQSGLVSFVFEEASPLTIGDIDMSYDSENELSKLMVSFSYRKYSIENV